MPRLVLAAAIALVAASASAATVAPSRAQDRPDWATYDDAGATQAIREALAASRRESGLPDLHESAELSMGLVRSVTAAAAADSIRDRPVPFRPKAQFFFFTASDPTRLPVLVSSMARGAHESAVAATFRRTPRHPDGIYWVALALE